MIAYKGFTETLWSKSGDSKKENCQFAIGETKTVPESKTARSGFHCCENPFDCLTYYEWNGDNRFFKVEAGGDIDEDDNYRIACTQITLLDELNIKDFAAAGMAYILNHPSRDGWEQDYRTVKVQPDRVIAYAPGSIAIARGSSPRAKGVFGSCVGLIEEDETGITAMKLLMIGLHRANKWITLEGGRIILEEEEN